MLGYLAIFCCLLGIQADSFSQHTDPEVLIAGHFSAARKTDPFPENWGPFTFQKIKRHTRYYLVKDGGNTVIKAESNASASGLIRKIHIDPSVYPVIQWRWKVEGIFKKGDVHQKAGDDYPARIYITFHKDPDRMGFFEKAKAKTAQLLYGQEPPHSAVTYIWGNKAPVGTIVKNPYTDRAAMIVVRSGIRDVGRWFSETRNLRDDYLEAFGEKPPPISGVAIMTDSDNTGEAGLAFYGDILFRKRIRQDQQD